MPDKHYGFADRAWHPVIGCSPKMDCAENCWARRTMARVVRCQQKEHPERAQFYQIALTPDLQQWSGEVFLDLNHIDDPLDWKKPASIASGFHGDWARLSLPDQMKVLAVVKRAQQHSFYTLTKQPQALFLAAGAAPLKNLSIGVSVMDQDEADRVFPAMKRIASAGWATHVWHEPARGPVNWKGWEFLLGMITGGESGPVSRPMHPDWARMDRDFCVEHDIPFRMKQWGDWREPMEGEEYTTLHGRAGKPPAFLVAMDGTVHCFKNTAGDAAKVMICVGKKAAGRLLDGRTWDGMPEVRQ